MGEEPAGKAGWIATTAKLTCDWSRVNQTLTDDTFFQEKNSCLQPTNKIIPKGTLLSVFVLIYIMGKANLRGEYQFSLMWFNKTYQNANTYCDIYIYVCVCVCVELCSVYIFYHFCFNKLKNLFIIFIINKNSFSLITYNDLNFLMLYTFETSAPFLSTESLSFVLYKWTGF